MIVSLAKSPTYVSLTKRAPIATVIGTAAPTYADVINADDHARDVQSYADHAQTVAWDAERDAAAAAHHAAEYAADYHAVRTSSYASKDDVERAQAWARDYAAAALQNSAHAAAAAAYAAVYAAAAERAHAAATAALSADAAAKGLTWEQYIGA